MADNIQLIDRAFEIIECLCLAGQPLGPTAIADKIGLSESTVHRILSALSQNDYVERFSDGSYTLGYRLINLVGCYIDSLELITEARPYVAMLSADLGLTAHLGVLDQGEVIYVEKLDAIPTGRLSSQIGFRVPAYCSSLGKCLLASLSGEALDEMLSHCTFQRYTDKTIVDAASFRQHLREVRARGWGMDDGEYEPNHRCIGAPIFDYRGDAIAAIAASGSTLRLSDNLVPKVAAAVCEAAEKISHRLGYVK